MIKAYFHLMRLHYPVGILLLWLPCLIGMAITYQSYPFSYQDFLFYGVLFGIGSLLMRGAGCVINDYHDREFDKYVARTKNRPLASGQISPRQALLFFGILCLISSTILLFLPLSAIYTALLLGGLVVLYPLMKRITYWPQLFLGIVFNGGVLVGAFTILSLQSWDDVPLSVLWIYGMCILHTLAYDTIYAFQDVDDDRIVGIKSSAQKVQNHPKLFLSSCYGGMLFCWYHAVSFYDLWFQNITMMVIAGGLFIPLWFWNPKCPVHHKRMFHLAIIQLLMILLFILGKPLLL